MEKQSTSSILMVRPRRFGFNDQTAVSNFFVNKATKYQEVHQKALREFDQLAEVLERHGIKVSIFEAMNEPYSPDSIFPNNWISTHEDGSTFLYPMEAPNRRMERREDILATLSQYYQVKEIIDLTHFERQNQFLEGTGSMILDRRNKIAYACLSSRTSKSALSEFCRISGYRAVTFNAVDKNNRAIYHSNVMMSVGSDFSLVCTESIRDSEEIDSLNKSLQQTEKQIIPITLEQVNHFAGNILEIRSNKGEPMIIMSEQAFKSLRPEQIKRLERFGDLLFSPLYTIEAVGGGSARCMIAEIFLPILSDN
ncbi:citrulline utilization hydrolase CtlX [Desertivirga arenae]|uniref:citrulline utilization hydrolase CtlX n=1 Tax=Desertivirga arenae TaxID=2810309 RepID=UPI001A95F6C1|nr:arginine deiminase-related protein [Pedobacter sp. SYSU D00823]